MAIVYAGALSFSLYGAVDNYGWIIHNRHTPAYMDSDWVNAGYRNCTLYTTIRILECGNAQAPGATEHIVPVKYHGRIDRKDHHYVTWRCQRNNRGLECWARD